MDVGHQVMGERAGTRSGAWAGLRQLPSLWRVFLFTELAWLIISVVVLRFALASVAIVGVLVGVTVMLGASGQFLIAAIKASLPLGRRLAGYVLAAAVAPLLTLLLASLRGQLDLTTDVLAFLVAVMAVALAGGLIPGMLEAVGGSLLISFYFIPPGHTVAMARANNAAVLGVFVAVALAVSLVARDAGRRTRQAARAAAECELLATAAASVLRGPEALTAVLDQVRAAYGLESVTLLERGPSVGNLAGRAVGWTPVAVSGGPPITRPIDAAVTVPATGCLCSGDIALTAEDHNELLATADESLEQLAYLVTSLLDVSRLRAGALPVFPRPADLGEIIACSLDGFGPAARAVTVDFPPDLPQVMADPPIMERIIVNLIDNALRYSPTGSPLLLTAGAYGDQVELRVIDRGPGIPEAERDRAFMPFERLGDTSSPTSVGLGLTVSRGLTEAMGGTLKPEETPGGGLTMAISLPAVPSPGPGIPGLAQEKVHSYRTSSGACPSAGTQAVVTKTRHTQTVRIGDPRRGKHLAHWVGGPGPGGQEGT